MIPKITQIYRYPFKGLSAESLTHVSLTMGQGIPFDRYFALAHESTDFDPAAPQHFSKVHFLMLMKNERLASLRTRYDITSGFLTIEYQGQQVIHENLQSSQGIAATTAFFIDYLGDEIQGKPQLLHAPKDYMFSDVDAKVLSFINLASVRELGRIIGTEIHPLRFRANIYFDHIEAWRENDWINREFSIGSAKFRVLKLTERCPATNVNPVTGQRDLTIPQTLYKTYQHRNLGFYAHVIQAGDISVNDTLKLL